MTLEQQWKWDVWKLHRVWRLEPIEKLIKRGLFVFDCGDSDSNVVLDDCDDNE